MKIISNENLEIMNFSDFTVLNIILNKSSKSIGFYLNGACYFKERKRIELGKGYFSIMGYDTIYITSYNAKESIEKILSEEDFESLRELCEISIKKNEIIIKGFSEKTSNWIEFSIVGGRITGEFKDI